MALVTNGILVRQMKQSLIDAILKYNVEVHISAYPPLFGKMDEITDFLQEKGICYRIVGPIFEFSKNLDLSVAVPYPFHSIEATCGCYVMHQGKIAMCASACFASYHDEANGTDELRKISEGAVIELKEVKSFKELKERLITPREICNHCVMYRSEYDEELREKWQIYKDRRK